MKILDHIKHSFAEIAFFAAVFSGLGWLVPEIYYKYFDTTQYYSIQNPITVEGTIFRACDKMIVEIHRKALISTQAVSVRELVLLRDGVEVARFKNDLAINLSEEVVHAEWSLPCGISAGKYVFRGVVSYKFRGLDKSTEFYTTEFEVIN